jgi:hypothetical protein
MTKLYKEYFIEISLTFLFLLFVLFIFFNKSTFDSGDSIQHYQMSRYSWQHPKLFFNHWGKPFFTVLSSPFSQFGFKGIQVFNILVSVLSGYFVYKSASKLGYVTSYLPLVILFAATDYFLCMYSGLTEPLFGLILILSFYLIISDKFLIATVVLSFLPFVRSEGNIILIVYAVYFIVKKKYLFIPLLMTGTIVYSIAGYFVYYDIGWIFNNNPYTSGYSNYGKGGPFHYVKQLNFLAGIPYCVLLVAGVAFFVLKFLKKSDWKNSPYQTEIFFLIFGTFFGYFVSHSIFWWKGLFHSFGMSRVLIGILPVGVIICLGPVDALLKRYPSKYVLPVLSVLMIAFLFSGNKAAFDLKNDFSMDPSQALAVEMNKWYNVNYPGVPVVIAAPHIAYIMEKDYFDTAQCSHFSVLNDSLPKDKLIIWDSWMSVMEFGITDHDLDSRKNLTQIKKISDGMYTLKIYLPNDKANIKK